MSTISPKRTVIVADPCPAAAFLLGGYSRMVKDWIDGCANWSRDHLRLQPALVIRLNEMDTTVINLQDEIEADVCKDLRAAIKGVKDCIVGSFDYSEGVINQDLLQSEADRAFSQSHPLFPWYDFGRIIGHYRVMLKALDVGAKLPDFNSLLSKAQKLAEGAGKDVPLLQSLVDLGGN
jgi:hypothetical protein